MNLRILMLTAASTFAFTGLALAADSTATPMSGDAMASDTMMAGDAMAPMDADQILADCLAKAEMEADAMKKDDASKACHDARDMAGDAMAGDAMAGDAMAGDAMAPKQ